MQEELDAYNAALEDEMEREKQKHQRNLEALNHRKEDMIKEKKQKLKVSIYYILLIFTEEWERRCFHRCLSVHGDPYPSHNVSIP